ncbi:MAG: hypothetical protein U9P07_05800 [Pseudomonadota bacterium]|nr:hypothetical protein [Pseudomonadota bacterium]
MALAHSRRPSMAGFRGVRRESQWGTVLKTVPTQAANTAISQARTSCIPYPWQYKLES